MDNLYLDNYQLNTELDEFTTSAQQIDQLSFMLNLSIKGTVAIELIQKQQEEIFSLSNAFKTFVLNNINPQLNTAVKNINNTDSTAATQLNDIKLGIEIFNNSRNK